LPGVGGHAAPGRKSDAARLLDHMARGRCADVGGIALFFDDDRQPVAQARSLPAPQTEPGSLQPARLGVAAEFGKNLQGLPTWSSALGVAFFEDGFLATDVVRIA